MQDLFECLKSRPKSGWSKTLEILLLYSVVPPVSQSALSSKSSKITNHKTKELWSWNFERMFNPRNMSHVTCHMLCVTCHMSHVTVFLLLFFPRQSGEGCQWRVYYQLGLPRLVSCFFALCSDSLLLWSLATCFDTSTNKGNISVHDLHLCISCVAVMCFLMKDIFFADIITIITLYEAFHRNILCFLIILLSIWFGFLNINFRIFVLNDLFTKYSIICSCFRDAIIIFGQKQKILYLFSFPGVTKLTLTLFIGVNNWANPLALLK